MVSSQWNMNHEGHRLHLSTFVVTCAYTSVCMVKALGEGDEKRKILILFSSDCRGRTRLDPLVPSNYFGNCIRVLDMLAIAKDFTEENAVSIVAKRIGDVIKGMENGGVLKGAEKTVLKIKDLKDLQTISVAGSIRFDVYGMDFGWGRPKKVEVTSIDRCGGGAIFLNQSRHGEGEGVEVGLALTRQEMEAFACHFVNGLNDVQGWLETGYSS